MFHCFFLQKGNLINYTDEATGKRRRESNLLSRNRQKNGNEVYRLPVANTSAYHCWNLLFKP